MKKIIICILLVVAVIVAIVFAHYIEYSKQKTEISKINNEFLKYQKSIVRINEIVSLTNRAIDLNNKNNVKITDDNSYIENDTNSIKVYVKINSVDQNIEMEKLILNRQGGSENVEYAFSDLVFEIKDVKYHKNGQIKSILFVER